MEAHCFHQRGKFNYYELSIVYLLIRYMIAGSFPVVMRFHFYFGECNMLLEVVAYEDMNA